MRSLSPLLSAALLVASMLQADDRHFPVALKATNGALLLPEANWYSQSLWRMKEPTLHDGRHTKGVTAYRLLILPFSGNPIAIRVTKGSENFYLSSSRLDGRGAYDAGKLVEQLQVTLSSTDSKTLAALLNDLHLFEQPTNEPLQGLEGEQWILEGVDSQKYHVLHRWCAGRDTAKRGLAPFVSLCRFLLSKSELSTASLNEVYKLLPTK